MRGTVSISCLLPVVDVKLLNPFTFAIRTSTVEMGGKGENSQAHLVCTWLSGLEVFRYMLPLRVIKPQLPFLQSNPGSGESKQLIN